MPDPIDPGSAWMKIREDDLRKAREDGLAVAETLLRKVADYWLGRPLSGHGAHIYADLIDVLRAITPAEQKEGGR